VLLNNLINAELFRPRVWSYLFENLNTPQGSALQERILEQKAITRERKITNEF
jgi:hypothetical protein